MFEKVSDGVAGAVYAPVLRAGGRYVEFADVAPLLAALRAVNESEHSSMDSKCIACALRDIARAALTTAGAE